jgi:DNA mismatch repair protein MutL
MTEINILEDSVINKIAAGEVVERPVSIVKELLENSLDAGSSRISVTAEEGGKKLISVEDNGRGIGRDDLALAVLRYATSKIRNEDDLETIETLGFRGEALAAISSVSRMRIESRRRGERDGYAMECAGGKAGDLFPVGAQEGTRITVGDLFFNTPARSKFLKSDATELTHIITLIESYSLARPEVAFCLRAGGASIIDLTPSPGERERFFDLFPELDKNDFHEITFESPALALKGLLGMPSKNLSTSKYLFTIVNGRLVKDKLLQSSIFRAYEDTMPKGRYPLVFLNLELPPGDLDVNVHPTKREVRFRQSNMVFETVSRELGKVVRPAGNSPAAAFTHAAPLRAQSSFVKEPLPLFGQKEDSARTFISSAPAPSNYKVLAIWRNGFIILDGPAGLSIVDQHTLHERIRFEQFRRFIEQEGPRQTFLEPRAYSVPRALTPRIDELAGSLNSQGFEAEVIGEASIAVRSAPSFLLESEVDPLVEEFIAEGSEVLRTPKELLKSVLIMRSCRGSVMLNDPLSNEKAQYLIDLLFSMNAPLTCPHGRPIMFTLKNDELLLKFHRR